MFPGAGGIPVKMVKNSGYIDSMQLVMRRDLWLAEGGYYDKSPNGDGIMYQKFAEKYGYRTVSMPLGEHF
jgi:hypothetical protein